LIQGTALEVRSVLQLIDHVPWFGKHAGYERLPEYTAQLTRCEAVAIRSTRAARYLGGALAQLRGLKRQGSTSLAHIEMRLRRRLHRPDVTHILYGENHLEFFKVRKNWPRDIVTTLHLPPRCWDDAQRATLKKLKSAILLYQRDRDFFEDHVGDGRTAIAPHGVDVEFFRPAAAPPSHEPPRLLFGGVWLRNEPMLVRVAMRLLERRPELRFDLLIPQHHVNSEFLRPLLAHEASTVYCGLSDAQLLRFYQCGYLMLLPMDDSGANNTILEALACGLPVVTTNVGGVADYGGGEVYPLVENNDDQAMVNLVENYLENVQFRNAVSAAARTFAATNLAWPVVALKHLEAYTQLCT
jgi:glycosyltransferase involved in cell wall biosynthesis